MAQSKTGGTNTFLRGMLGFFRGERKEVSFLNRFGRIHQTSSFTFKIPQKFVVWATSFRLGLSPVQAVHRMQCTLQTGELPNLKEVAQTTNFCGSSKKVAERYTANFRSLNSECFRYLTYSMRTAEQLLLCCYKCTVYGQVRVFALVIIYTQLGL